MSIWCSSHVVGFDQRAGWAKRPTGGTVRAYAEGWSNHYPTNDVEGPAAIDLATVPVWCVPGHHDETPGSERRCGPWLRMTVTAEGTDHWNGGPTPYYSTTTVVLNERAARALRDHLDEWLSRPKARPRKGAA